MKILFALIAFAFLVGCASGYKTFYKGAPDARVLPGYLPSTDEPMIIGATDPKTDTENLWRRGYSFVGSASFTAGTGSVSDRQLVEQAKRIGAHVVVSSSKYDSTVSGAMPITTPTSSTSYSTGSATAYGSGGSVTAFGNSTTTTYGSQTSYVPYSTQRNAYVAAFFAKGLPRFGVLGGEIDASTKRAIDSNYGIVVRAVSIDSPAFAAGIFEEDIITSIAGRPVSGPAGIAPILDAVGGQTVPVEIFREGKLLTKQVSVRKW